MGLRGGARPGAGRPVGTGKFSETTKPVRLPVSSLDHVFNFIGQKCLQIPKCLDTELLQYTDTRPSEKWYLGSIRPDGDVVAVTVTNVLTSSDINKNDVLLVKRNIIPKPGEYIIIKTYDSYAVSIMKDDLPADVWGVVVCSIRPW